MAKFAKGADTAEERAARTGTFGGRVPYLGSSIGTKKHPTFIRMLTDKPDWITVDVHANVPTKPKPEGQQGKWPEAMSAVCANDVAFRTELPDGGYRYDDPVDHYGHCYIHEKMADVTNRWGRPVSKPATTHFGLCVLREPVMDGDRIVGFKDKMEDWEDKDGGKHKVPAIRLASQKWSNFFGPIAASSYVSGTTCTSDFMVTKEGTEVEVSSLGATPDHHPGAPTWKAYDDAIELMGIDVEKTIIEQSSRDYYDRFFNAGVVTKARGGKPSGEVPEDEEAAQAAAPNGSDPAAESAAASEDAITAFKERVAAAQGAGTKTGPS